MKIPFYVISTGRSGSTFISKYFKHSYPILNIGHQMRGSRIINILSNLPFSGEKFVGLLLFLMNLYGRAEGVNIKSTADPLLSMAILKIALSKNIEAKYIHLVRNPYSYINSFTKWKNQSIKRWILHHLIPFWNPVPFLEDKSISLIEWLLMPKSIVFAWIWQYKNRHFSNLQKKYPNSYLLIRLEDITNKDELIRQEALHKLKDFIGRKNEFKDGFELKRKVNTSKSNLNITESWNDKNREKFSVYCKEMMLLYEYKNKN